MFTLLYVYLVIITFESALCQEHFEYEENDVKIINTDDGITLIKCEYYRNLNKFSLPARQLAVNNKIRFLYCDIPVDFKLSTFFEDLGVNVTWLDILSTASLKKYNLIGLENLRHLSITYSNEHYDADLLQNLPNLDELCITSYYYLTDIPVGFFKYSSNLNSLQIIETRLKILKKEQFEGLENLSRLKLSISFEAKINDDAFDRLKSLKSLEISYDNLKILPATSLNNLLNLETITVFNEDRFFKGSSTNESKFYELPNELFANFKSLKALNLKSVGSKELKKDIFNDNFGVLQNLSISGYYSTILPRGIFDNLRNLRELQIIQNDISSLRTDTFKNLEKLVTLDLSYNKLRILNM